MGGGDEGPKEATMKQKSIQRSEIHQVPKLGGNRPGETVLGEKTARKARIC